MNEVYLALYAKLNELANAICKLRNSYGALSISEVIRKTPFEGDVQNNIENPQYLDMYRKSIMHTLFYQRLELKQKIEELDIECSKLVYDLLHDFENLQNKPSKGAYLSYVSEYLKQLEFDYKNIQNLQDYPMSDEFLYYSVVFLQKKNKH